MLLVRSEMRGLLLVPNPNAPSYWQIQGNFNPESVDVRYSVPQNQLAAMTGRRVQWNQALDALNVARAQRGLSKLIYSGFFPASPPVTFLNPSVTINRTQQHQDSHLASLYWRESCSSGGYLNSPNFIRRQQAAYAQSIGFGRHLAHTSQVSAFAFCIYALKVVRWALIPLT